MKRYILKRLLMAIPVLLGITLLINVVMSLVPGDAARVMLGEQATEEQVDALRQELGLNQPFLVQYARYVGRAVQGDLGRSFRTKRTVMEELNDTIPPTFRLSAVALVLTVLVGVPLGVVAAVKQRSLTDNLSMLLSLLFLSMPVFWVGLLLIYYLAFLWPLFPTGGTGTWLHYVLPAFTLSASAWATVARMTRSSMLEVLREDFIRTAHSKGLSKQVVIYKHALKNALIPVITVLGLQVGLLMGGAVLTETVFSWPGVGRLMVSAIQSRDLMIVQGAVAFLAVIFVLLNLIVDLAYAYVDPRIRYQ